MSAQNGDALPLSVLHSAGSTVRRVGLLRIGREATHGREGGAACLTLGRHIGLPLRKNLHPHLLHFIERTWQNFAISQDEKIRVVSLQQKYGF